MRGALTRDTTAPARAAVEPEAPAESDRRPGPNTESRPEGAPPPECVGGFGRAAVLGPAAEPNATEPLTISSSSSSSASSSPSSIDGLDRPRPVPPPSGTKAAGAAAVGVGVGAAAGVVLAGSPGCELPRPRSTDSRDAAMDGIGLLPMPPVLEADCVAAGTAGTGGVDTTGPRSPTPADGVLSPSLVLLLLVAGGSAPPGLGRARIFSSTDMRPAPPATGAA